MRRDLLIAAGPGEWRAALLEDGAPVELYIERGDTKLAGSIHLGRVVRLAPGLDSAFVEIGDARPGLVPVREAAAEGIGLHEGARVLVQVRREAQQGKGARLSTRIAARPGLTEQETGLESPAQLYPAPGLANALRLRLPAPPETVRIDDQAAIVELRAAFSDAEVTYAERAEWPTDPDAAIETALSSTLMLTGGGAIHLEETRAALLIDVDTGMPAESSGKRGAVAANREAARAIAQQLRLRNIGGGIVIDFVGLEGGGRRDRVRQTLAAALAADPARPEILGWTRLGHLELVRPRRGRSLGDAMLEPTFDKPRRKHALALANEALRALWREARARPAANWRLFVSPALRTALQGQAAGGLRVLEARLGRRIDIVADPSLTQDFDIGPV